MEEVLKLMATVEGATEYLVTNAEGRISYYAGIPIKKSAGITNERALHISYLINDYWSTTRKIIHNDLKQSDVIEDGRRTKSRRSGSGLRNSNRSSSSSPSVPLCLPRRRGHSLPGAELRDQKGSCGRQGKINKSCRVNHQSNLFPHIAYHIAYHSIHAHTSYTTHLDDISI